MKYSNTNCNIKLKTNSNSTSKCFISEKQNENKHITASPLLVWLITKHNRIIKMIFIFTYWLWQSQ